MTSTRFLNGNFEGIQKMLSTSTGNGPSFEDKMELMVMVRGDSPEVTKKMDMYLVGEVTRLQDSVEELISTTEKLRSVVKKLTLPPHHLATYLGDAVGNGGTASAVVSYGTGRRVVALGADVDASALSVGDDVCLGSDLNVLLDRAPQQRPGGEIATFKRFVGVDRLVLESRDEEVVVLASAAVLADAPDPGDLVLWDRGRWLALLNVGRSDGKNLLLEGTPTESFADIGGLDDVIERLQRAIRLRFEFPHLAEKYGLRMGGGFLLAGPPGNGKTMLARGVANWLARLSGSGKANFIMINPGELHSMWYSKAEENYREAFRVAREAGEANPNVPVVMFFDELDSCGAIRGDTATGTSDRVLSALLAELDGFTDRGNVVVIGATNRLDAIDPALLRAGRFGDCVLEVSLPDRTGARQILSRTLKETVPVAPIAGCEGESRRGELIEGLLSIIYSANGMGEVASLMMRDGSTYPIEPKDLFSGADLAKTVRDASEAACRREASGGACGMQLEDLAAAAEREIEQKLLSLTPRNCAHHLPRLPDNADVVAVTRREKRVQRQHRQLRTL